MNSVHGGERGFKGLMENPNMGRGRGPFLYGKSSWRLPLIVIWKGASSIAAVGNYKKGTD